jgi:hypothetical protein
MERSEILATMGELKLYGMRAAFDEIITTAVKRQHEPQRVVGDLLSAEISEKQARSIKYQITIAKLPLAKDVDDFRFDGTPISAPWCATSSAATSWRISATLCWSAGPVPRSRISPSQSLAPAFVAVPEAGSSMSLIWSTDLRPRADPDGRGAWPTICAARISSCSTNSAICRSHKLADSCCSTWSAGSMSRHR